MEQSLITKEWEVLPVDEAATSIVGGGTPSKSNASYFQGSIPWMTVKDMNKNILQDTVDHISEEAVENSSTNIIPAGVPIIATRMSLGKIVVANFDSAINQDLKAIFLSRYVLNSFFIYWYRSISRVVESFGTGTTVKGIRLEVLKELKLPLPPQAEQKVIAEKLDTLLAQVETTKARLNRIPHILKRFRQSVLAAAVSGKLTEDWRVAENITEPRKYLMDDLIEKLDQGWSPKCINNPVSNNEWGVIKTSAVQSGYFVAEENKKLPNTLEPRVQLAVAKGDVLITRAGPRVRCGVTCIVENDYPNLMICDKVYRIRVREDFISPKFLNWCFNSPQYLKDIEALKTGSSESGMNMTQKKMREMQLQVPTIEEQTEIVHRVERLFAFADKIEQQVQQAQQRVNHLTQSILAKAFRGELTEQWRRDHPDLISGEHSAQALLDKIRAEREAMNTKKPPKKRTTKRKASDKG